MLQLLNIKDSIIQESAKKELYERQAENRSIQSTGLAIANAKAQAEAEEISGLAEVNLAQYQMDAQKIVEECEIELIKETHEEELKFQAKMTELETERKKLLADIEARKL